MAEKLIRIGAEDVLFRSTGATPRIYRNMFHRELFNDLKVLGQKLKAVQGLEGDDLMESGFDIPELTMFENLAYVMCAEEKPKSPDEWLEQFETFAIYEILPELLELWDTGTMPLQTAPAGKKK